MADSAVRKRVDDFETKFDADSKTQVASPEGIVKRWMAELALASKQEQDWRKEAAEIYQRYENEKEQSGRQSSEEATFNILWSNTEILVPALYNSTPTPDVRRRFRGEDPVGKFTGTVLERAIACEIDGFDFDDEVTAAVLDLSLVGRGIARIRYRPRVAEHPATTDTPDGEPSAQDPAATGTEQAGEPEPYSQAPAKRIVDQKTEIEHVQWDKFRRGPGKRWRDVPWVSFEHDMTYDDLVEYFGEEVAQKVPLSELSEADQAAIGEKNSEACGLFQSATVHEIWDKLKRRVLFIAQGVEEPLYIDEDPTLKIKGFFPIPRPAMAIVDSRSLVPIPLYRQYRAQARELELCTQRIRAITRMIRIRGLRAANVKEVDALMDAADGDMIPVEDVAALAQVGLDKLVWIMPVDKLVQVLEGLYKSRHEIKQTIYEIVGLSDIMRGASKATETLGAQELKSRWGSVRLQRMQKEVQRFVRDLLRMIGEVVSEQYEPDVLARMTQVQLPTAADKQLVQMGMQQAQAMGQQIPPEQVEQAEKVFASPTWEDVIAVLRSDTMRQYKVNIETDSTIAEILDRDFNGITQVLQALGAVFGAAPALQQAGAQNGPEVTKEIALSVVRHARMGRAVEDSIEDLDFKGGTTQLEQLGQMVQQMGQAVQQGAEQLAQMGQRLQQHDQVLGQIVKVLQAGEQASAGPRAIAPAA